PESRENPESPHPGSALDLEKRTTHHHEKGPAQGHPADEERLLGTKPGQVDTELGNGHREQRWNSGEAGAEECLRTIPRRGQRQRGEEAEPRDETDDPQRYVPGIRREEAVPSAEGVPLQVVPDDPAGPKPLDLGILKPRDGSKLIGRLRD